MRKLKMVALALVALGAFSAVAASSASAFYEIKGSEKGGTISGSQTVTNEFVTDVGTVKCTGATFTASQATETAETLTVKPVYETCTLSGVKVTVNTEKCHYLFTKPTTTDALSTPITTHASVHIVCDTNGGGTIVIKDTSGLGCEVHVGEQTPEGVVEMTNNADGTVTVESKVTGISYTWTAGCPNAGGKAGSNTNGQYKGSVKVSGKNPGGEAKGIAVT